jgi:2-dehydro-3-deoxygalactonokinase
MQYQRWTVQPAYTKVWKRYPFLHPPKGLILPEGLILKMSRATLFPFLFLGRGSRHAGKSDDLKPPAVRGMKHSVPGAVLQSPQSEANKGRRTMSATQNQTHWTAATIGENAIILWAVTSREVLHRHSYARSALPPQQDLICALEQMDAAKTSPVLVAGLDQTATVEVPAKPADLALRLQERDGWQLQTLPNLMQKSPLALMQGSGTQIAGFLALNPKWDGVICLPGPVTHWVQVSAAEIVSFQSTLTTGLQASLCEAMGLGTSWAESALHEAIPETLSRPERLASRLAELQATVRLQSGDNTEEMAGKLWGYLLGAELAAARPYWLGQNLALIAEDALAAPYLAALCAQGLPVTRAQPDRMALEGLIQAWRHMQGEAANL